AVGANSGAVEHDGAHADEAVGADAAAVQHDVVADDAVRPDREREPGIGMQGAIVLYLRALAELDPFVVAAQHRAEPDAGVAPEPDTADQRRAVGDPVAPVGGKLRLLTVKLVDHAAQAAMSGVRWRGGSDVQQPHDFQGEDHDGSGHQAPQAGDYGRD